MLELFIGKQQLEPGAEAVVCPIAPPYWFFITVSLTTQTSGV